ncbi:unnamed protein product [Alopecurus aequalis]
MVVSCVAVLPPSPPNRQPVNLVKMSSRYGISSDRFSCHVQRDNPDDRLNKLPDDILVTILERLHVRDATRASVLSRRWRHLPAMLSSLNIDLYDFHEFHPEDRPTICDDEIARVNAATVEATKSILANRDSDRNTIRSLQVSFFLKDDDAISIGRAVGHTMATRNVEMAEFTVLTEKEGDYNVDDDFVRNGRQFMSFFEACPIAFGGLTSLRLESLTFGELDISNVLTVCKRLKYLRLVHCESESWPLLVQHLQLSELAIVECSFVGVELSSLPKLTRMTFTGWTSLDDELYLGYVPLLEALSLCNVCLSSHEMVNLSKFLVGTSLRDLKLGFECEKIWVQPECRQASVFNKLRSVYLDEIPEGYDLTWTLSILEVAPKLKELYLTVWDHLCKMQTDDEDRQALSYSENKGIDWESSTSNFRHNNLATLVIFGFHHEDYMVKYVRRVMEAAMNLEDVFLWPRRTCRECNDNPPKPCKFPFTEPEKCLLGTRISFGLQSSATVHFSTGKNRADHDARMVFP